MTTTPICRNCLSDACTALWSPAEVTAYLTPHRLAHDPGIYAAHRRQSWHACVDRRRRVGEGLITVALSDRRLVAALIDQLVMIAVAAGVPRPAATSRDADEWRQLADRIATAIGGSSIGCYAPVTAERMREQDAEIDRLTKALDYAIADYGRASRRADAYMSDLMIARRAAATLTAERDDWQAAARAHEAELLARDGDIIDLRAQLSDYRGKLLAIGHVIDCYDHSEAIDHARDLIRAMDLARAKAAALANDEPERRTLEEYVRDEHVPVAAASLPSPVVTPPVAGAVPTDEELAEAHYAASCENWRSRNPGANELPTWAQLGTAGRPVRADIIAGIRAVRGMLATPAPADVTAALGDALIPGESIATAVARVAAERDAYGDALAAINTAPAPRPPAPVAWMAVSAEGRGCIAFAREAVEQQVADRGYPDGDRETVVYTPLYAAPAPRESADRSAARWMTVDEMMAVNRNASDARIARDAMRDVVAKIADRVGASCEAGAIGIVEGWRIVGERILARLAQPPAQPVPAVDDALLADQMRETLLGYGHSVGADDPMFRADFVRLVRRYRGVLEGMAAARITPPTSRRPEIGDRVWARIEGRLANVEPSGRHVVEIAASRDAKQFVWVDAAEVELLGETGGVR